VNTRVVRITGPERGIGIWYAGIESCGIINNTIEWAIDRGNSEMSSRRIDRSNGALKDLGRVLSDEDQTGDVSAIDDIPLNLVNVRIEVRKLIFPRMSNGCGPCHTR